MCFVPLGWSCWCRDGAIPVHTFAGVFIETEGAVRFVDMNDTPHVWGSLRSRPLKDGQNMEVGWPTPCGKCRELSKTANNPRQTITYSVNRPFCALQSTIPHPPPS